MTAKQYLDQIRNYQRHIDRINDEIDRLESVATNTTQSLSGMPHNPSPTQSRMADAICKIIDKQHELEAEKDKMEALRTEVAALIAQLENADYRDLLGKRYLESKAWEDIIYEMGFERSWVYRIHQKALAEVQKALDKKEAM